MSNHKTPLYSFRFDNTPKDSKHTSTPKPVSKTWPPKPLNVPTEIPRHKKIDKIADKAIERIESDE